MNKYKVEFIQTSTYVIDVLAQDEQEATDKASNILDEKESNGTEHYHMTSESGRNVGTVYDVTNTDDQFDA